jgi:hypothetical protein
MEQGTTCRLLLAGAPFHCLLLGPHEVQDPCILAHLLMGIAVHLLEELVESINKPEIKMQFWPK